MNETKAIYAGSFDPITLGHLDIIEKAVEVFDSVIVAVGHNPKKTGLFTVQERIDLIEESIVEYNMPVDEDLKSNVIVTSFNGLLIDFAESHNATHLVRGLRAASDFDMEFTLNGTNAKLNPDIVTTFFMAPEEFLFVSSSTVKELAVNHADVSWMVMPCVEKALQEKYKEN